MSNININKLKNFDAIGAARESKINNAGKSDSQAVSGKSVSPDSDKLNFSSRVSDLSKFADTLRELPDVREERVLALRERIASGDYQPSSEDIASAILLDEAK